MSAKDIRGILEIDTSGRSFDLSIETKFLHKTGNYCSYPVEPSANLRNINEYYIEYWCSDGKGNTWIELVIGPNWPGKETPNFKDGTIHATVLTGDKEVVKNIIDTELAHFKLYIEWDT